ncbi:MAG: carotenoid biosynthesis protein [Acidobacteriaceae bacterium]|nr:carotenoid biosynthesis protein [Acidobacteriaceae bacterium]
MRSWTNRATIWMALFSKRVNFSVEQHRVSVLLRLNRDLAYKFLSTKQAALFWLLLWLYAVARILQVFPAGTPMLIVVALHVIPPALFAFPHGAARYGQRSIIAFFTITLLVGGTMENIGIRTGFPFGRYYFTDVMGPKLFGVPVLLSLAYVGMGYLSWTLASLLIGRTENPLTGFRVTALPLLASCLMVAWDFAMDPVWSTIVHAWIWTEGGPYFGVPLSNFLGWCLTVYLIYQSFALYLRVWAPQPNQLPLRYWKIALLFYALSAAGNFLLLLGHPAASTISDATHMSWKVTDITRHCALISLLTMGTFALSAWVRVNELKHIVNEPELC